ncbi:MAG: PIG-L deacetylase family protein [Bellilinea sp.]
MAAGETEGWEAPQRILVILAHPDDPEFFLGGSIARWTGMGHKVDYCLFTRGDKGVNGKIVDPLELAKLREGEQQAAAAVLGVRSVQFLNYEDGYLTPDLNARREVVRVIRTLKPDIVVSCDPTNYFHRANRINHPDHRAAGQIVADAVFPAAGNPLFFPELRAEGLEAHNVKELWLSLPIAADISLDVTATWNLKFEALKQHKSQIADVEALRKNLWSRRTADSNDEHPQFLEHFRRIIF